MKIINTTTDPLALAISGYGGVSEPTWPRASHFTFIGAPTPSSTITTVHNNPSITINTGDTIKCDSNGVSKIS